MNSDTWVWSLAVLPNSAYGIVTKILAPLGQGALPKLERVHPATTPSSLGWHREEDNPAVSRFALWTAVRSPPEGNRVVPCW